MKLDKCDWQIDNMRIGKQEARCPKCGYTSGSFHPNHRDPYKSKLKCDGCGYKGKVFEFVSVEKWFELLANPVVVKDNKEGV